MNNILLKNIKWPDAIPCLPLMLNIITSAIPFIFSYTYNLSIYLTLLPAIPVLLFIYFSSKNLKRDLFISFISICSALLSTTHTSSHITLHNSKSRSYIKVKGVVENVHYYDEILNWDSPKGTKLSLKLFEVYKNSKWKKCTGKIQIIDEDNLLKYGDEIQVEGALFKYKKSDVFRIFSYETYLKSQGLTHWMRPDIINLQNSAQSYRWFFKQCFKIRDWIISRAGAGLKNEKDRKLLASMFFGYKGLLESEEKEIYKRSGTVHLFAVSGLHIGIAAGFILLLLQCLRINLKAQTITLISLLAFYVLMTGAPSSAVRAFVMISVWSIARGFMLPSNGLNNIAFSAMLLIIINPLNLISAGFYYTFIITAFLVITYNKSLEVFQDLSEKKLWMGRLDFDNNWTFKFFLLLTCSLSASLATFGLNILINQQVIPFALFTNMFASTLAWLSFMLAIFSISGITFLYSVQTLVLKMIRFTSESGEFSWFCEASVLVVSAYYILLFLIPTCSKKHIKIVGSLTLVLLIFTGWPQKNNNVKILVQSSSNIANIKIYNEGRTYLINCSSNQLVRDVFHKEVHTLILPDIRADHIRSLPSLLENTKVREIIIFRKPTAYLKRLLDEKKSTHLLKTFDSHHLINSTVIGKDHYKINLTDNAPDVNQLSVSLVRKALSTSKVSINTNSSNKSYTFKYSNTGYLKHFSF